MQGSRSPAVISVALQLPESEGSRRLTEKFPSTTSLWAILRVLETREKLNFTERGVPSAQQGAGRLFYETPQLVVLNREMASFADMQRTLAQIGVNSGNVLIRLGFRVTEQPLEEAMGEISRYFKDAADPVVNPAAGPNAAEKTVEAPAASQPSTSPAPKPASAPEPQEASSPPEVPAQTDSANPASTTAPPEPQPSAGGLSVYLPAAAPAPAAAAQPLDAADYVPTLEHAHSHQARLQRDARNRRLPSDRELAAARAERRRSRGAVDSVRVRIRLPDGALLEREFARGSGGPAGEGEEGPVAADVYALARRCLRRPDAPFDIRYYPDAEAGAAAVTRALPDSAALSLLDDDDDVTPPDRGEAAEGKGLGWRGNVLVSLAWGAGADGDAVRGPMLREDVRRGARALEVEMPVPAREEGDKMDVGGEKEKGLLGGLFKKDGAGKGGGDKEARLKSFLFGKKK